MQKLKFIDLFCGAGGLSYGFQKAGLNCVAGVDTDKPSLETFSHNFKDSLSLEVDLSQENFLDEILKNTKNTEVDVVIGGPPCQGFSLTGPRNFFDKRNDLYLAVFKSVKLFNPKIFLIENVHGLSTLYEGRIKKEIISNFSKLGYTVQECILNSADYGVPQIRKRLFFVGTKTNLRATFEFPNPTHNTNNYISCEEAISDLPSRENDIGLNIDLYTSSPLTGYQKLMRGKQKNLYNHVGTKHTQTVIDVISLVPDGKNHRSLPKGVGEHRKFNEAWTRYHSKKPSKTIDTGHRNHFHYKFNRVPTVRENARLQSFPDCFLFKGNKTQQYKQVGNAVPPLFAQAIAESIKSALAKKKDKSTQQVKTGALFHA